MKILKSVIIRNILLIFTFFKYHKYLYGTGTIIKSCSFKFAYGYIYKNCYLKGSMLHGHIAIHDNSSLENTILKGYNKIGRNCYLSNSQIDKYSYVADDSKINNLKVGKFCSIGPNFMTGYGTHPINRISTSPYFYSTSVLNNPFLRNPSEFDEYKQTEIANDVWIGANVFVKDGIQIGNGAIVATGSVVTSDVPAYAIVGGVPAKIIRFRHSDKTIQSLLNSAWWDRNNDWIIANINLFQEDVGDRNDFKFN